MSEIRTTIRIRRVPDLDTPIQADTPDELLRLLYANRGLSNPDEVAPGLEALAPLTSLHGLEAALDRLVAAIRSDQFILVVGDYDADGATGSALAVRGLRALGARQVSFLVPSRFSNGYGLSPTLVEAAHAQGAEVILTVDNGISSHTAIARAHALGLSVVVTDHHLPGDALPKAEAIVNPNQPGCTFPSKHLAGVGVVFYLLAALRRRLRESGWFGPGRPEPNLAERLDLVALGTVADVVSLDRNNRILVDQGLRRIRAGRACAGVLALLQVAGRDPARATATDLGFFVAPRLNAAGRLTEMSLGVECLLTDDPARALEMANQLDALNRERRSIEDSMKEAAESVLDALILDGESLPPGLCLFGEDWHQGVSGIVAARIRERYHRPTIAFADAGDGRLRGSGRSIEGLHLRDAIDWVDRRHPGLIEHFGGHAMAAGLTLRPGCLESFRDAFVEAVRVQLGDIPPTPEIRSDGALPVRLLTLETAEALRFAGPWGKDFPEPRFDDLFEVIEARCVGDDRRHLKLRVAPSGGSAIEAIAFGLGERIASVRGMVRLVYRLDINSYRGQNALQLLVDHLAETVDM
ncbi:single-stranded-DNA-specific exonuclease RecJ [Thermochromatium tepidum]|uniref:Single-stranded-DNA-specific exonuclease RecJ n=1 Tax=Thermochromatium tepidum ATCC 43061 TaxID=316276 RepID=A0A6I6EKM7_THETI|nr:single-stranded-DNA-specific exonuclease RecJ [Thermochromatium tepidum]QGU33637.1 single-stranded-DNA-specific exonuclease RecJ [Thermochromatium tepidum ATCC 43061]